MFNSMINHIDNIITVIKFGNTDIYFGNKVAFVGHLM